MARIDWLTACELAFFDRQNRLCLIGLTTHLAVPHLPLALNQLMLVARLAELQQVEEFAVSVDVVSPHGASWRDAGRHDVVIEVSGHFVLVALRSLALFEEGTYRFQLELAGHPPVSVSVPVLVVSAPDASQTIN